MTSFSSLPVELQQQCAQYLDIGTLKNLRLASRQTIRNLGSEALFETVVLKFEASSADRFNQVLGDEALRGLVKRIVVDGQDGTSHEEDPTDDDYEMTPWALAIPKIAEFPSVKDIELWFDEEVEADVWSNSNNLKQNEGYRKFYQELLYQSLGKARSVEGLTVKNAQDAIIGHTGEGDGFIDARKRLKRLALLIRTEETAAPETDHEQPGFQRCFDSALLVHWLMPTQSQLTSLTIYCDQPWNPDPCCDLSDFQFPNLVELALGNWPIAFDWQVDWITSHNQTLRKLSLTGCPIVYLVSGGEFSFDWPVTDSVFTKSTMKLFTTRWSDIFPIFQQRLLRLTCFIFKPSRPLSVDTYFNERFNATVKIDDQELCSDCYITYQDGTGPSPYTDDLCDILEPEDPNSDGLVSEDGDDPTIFFPPGERQDGLDSKALRQLLGTIRSNRSEAQQAKRDNI
ncbi:hypothetical protein P171DRAFT_472183 [Karstenula rhodostoma CBS 690.94]|uniref:F-box domain-containing protein n=1 Tax=Karstenula rhodostoma CBS 690.94 TaxID=1392251 RepID=A0A9P4PM40_9PLEO|nr:hypothetical protein P171DRAFT_472183 [Karstenula rhodostoma CBS 690.94]